MISFRELLDVAAALGVDPFSSEGRAALNSYAGQGTQRVAALVVEEPVVVDEVKKRRVEPAQRKGRK
jgi:hypothetical protein